MVVLTATASKRDVVAIKESVKLKTPLEVIGNPNQPNIYYKKVLHKGDDVDYYEEV